MISPAAVGCKPVRRHKETERSAAFDERDDINQVDAAASCQWRVIPYQYRLNADRFRAMHVC
jgi:hypothetical protein